MRTDEIGMFWADIRKAGARSTLARVMPPIPDTGWEPPKEFPNLSSASALAIDTETFDPEMKTQGPGWARSKGNLAGVSVGTPDGKTWYFPMRHTVEDNHNLDPEHVLNWLRDTLSNPNQPKIGANIIYDIGWLKQEGVHVAGELHDVQYAEALLAENSKVALDILGEKYLGEGKESNLLYQWCADYYGGNPTPDQRKNIYRAPPRIVGPYAESDADLPMRISTIQYPLLHQEGLYDLYRMECELIPLLVEMRFAGVRVDYNKADEVSEGLENKIIILHKELKDIVGFDVNPDARSSLISVFNQLRLPFGKTKKGNASFTKQFLETLEHPAVKHILEIRKLTKFKGTFIDGYIINGHVDGMVYGQFHSMRSDSGGTRSGRFSSSNPNLQNIPSRDKILAPLIRGMFVPDEDHLYWRRYDYSQIEYRFLAHFAIGSGSNELRDLYNNVPDTDYHEATKQLVLEKTGMLLDRKPIKNINFGLLYGMGKKKLTAGLGLSRSEGEELFAAYHKAAPFVSETMSACMEEAQNTGIITTILGRKSRFDLWEPASFKDKRPALPYNAALMQYGNIKRAYGHKALNRRLQGSAADLMKMAMLECWKTGVFKETGVPRLTVHDELNFSDPGGRDKAFKEMHYILENCMQLRVPILADFEIGPDWGHVS